MRSFMEYDIDNQEFIRLFNWIRQGYCFKKFSFIAWKKKSEKNAVWKTLNGILHPTTHVIHF